MMNKLGGWKVRSFSNIKIEILGFTTLRPQ